MSSEIPSPFEPSVILDEPANSDQVRTVVERRSDPSVITVQSSLSERQIRGIIHEYTSQHYALVTKRQQQAAERILRSQNS